MGCVALSHPPRAPTTSHRALCPVFHRTTLRAAFSIAPTLRGRGCRLRALYLSSLPHLCVEGSVPCHGAPCRPVICSSVLSASRTRAPASRRVHARPKKHVQRGTRYLTCFWSPSVPPPPLPPPPFFFPLPNPTGPAVVAPGYPYTDEQVAEGVALAIRTPPSTWSCPEVPVEDVATEEAVGVAQASGQRLPAPEPPRASTPSHCIVHGCSLARLRCLCASSRGGEAA
jgi:hypothetical protein